MIVFGQDGRIRTKRLYSIKSGYFPSRFFFRAKVVLIWQKWLYSGKSDCNWAKWLYMGKSSCIRAEVVVFRQR